MAEFLTTSGTSHYLEKIIIEAETEMTLVSPYLQISKILLERLKEAAANKVVVRIIYGKDKLNRNERNALEEIATLELYFSENLHAKCYFNESTMIITSMNMYEFSERNNREMGILIDAKKDQEIYYKASKEVKSILQFSKHEIIQKEIKNTGKNWIKQAKGFCVRCEEIIFHNPNAPYCQTCYNSWVQWNNYDFEENVCHTCGSSVKTTMAKPQCYGCYMES